MICHRIKTRPGLVLLISFFLLSCNSSIDIDGFSSREWKSDRNGCKGMRTAYVENIVLSKDRFLGQKEQSILDLLGRPDKNELLRRQQKFYIYYFEPGPLCDESLQASDSASYLSIHFNATGVVNEVFVYD